MGIVCHTVSVLPRGKSVGYLLMFATEHWTELLSPHVPAGSPSRGGDAAVYVKDINQPSLSTPFYSVLTSISVFIALSTVFLSINSPDNSPFSHSVLPVLYLPNWSFQPCISL